MTPKEESRLFDKLDSMDIKITDLQIDFARVETELKFKTGLWSAIVSAVTTAITTCSIMLIGYINKGD
jgi:hypothetical protein